MPAPNVTMTFSPGLEALRRQEAQRKAREDRMRNALEILASTTPERTSDILRFPRFVQRTAREGLGRE